MTTIPQIKLSDISWASIGNDYSSLIWPPTSLAKQVALTAHKHMNDLIVAGLIGAGTAICYQSSSLVKSVAKEQLKKVFAPAYKEPWIDMKQRWAEDPLVVKLGIISRIAYYAFTGKTYKPYEKIPVSSHDTDCFFDPYVQLTANRLTRAIQATIESGSSLPSVLLSGPPGVGKSMLMNKLANAAPNYMVFTASNVREAFKSNEQLDQVKKVFEKAKSANLPTVIVIDECELLFMDRRFLTRSKMFDEVALVNALLEITGTASNKFMLVLATNNPDFIDEALRSRMNYEIHVDLPAEEQRLAILKANIPLIFKKPSDTLVLTDEKVREMAKETDGFSGRTLVQFLNNIAATRDQTPDKELTDDVIAICMRELFAMKAKPEIEKPAS